MTSPAEAPPSRSVVERLTGVGLRAQAPALLVGLGHGGTHWLAATFYLLLPFIALVLIYAVPFVWVSFELAEVSQAPGGLPYRWIIKAALPAGFIILLLATISRLSQVWALLFFRGGNNDGA